MGNFTGKPDQFDGKNHGFRLRFSPTNQSIELKKWRMFRCSRWIPITQPLICMKECIWLVVSTYPSEKYARQLGLLFTI